MDQIMEYVNQFDGVKKEWLTELVKFMRTHNRMAEGFQHNIPTYRGMDYYISFASRKNYFSFYTDETFGLEFLKEQMPSAVLGKECVRIKYTEEDAVPNMVECIILMMRLHHVIMNENVTEIAAARKWFGIPEKYRHQIIENVRCSGCGNSRMAEGYSIQEDGIGGIVLRGKCTKCGHNVSRMVEIY